MSADVLSMSGNFRRGELSCCSPLPSLPSVVGIIIVDLPTGFNHEQKKSSANPGYHCEHDKKCFHDVAPQVPSREIYTTIDCTDDGENGFPPARDLGALRIRHFPSLLFNGHCGCRQRFGRSILSNGTSTWHSGHFTSR